MRQNSIIPIRTVDTLLPELDGWEREDILLKKTFVFENFTDITRFLQHLVTTITTYNHHPDMQLDTRDMSISITLTTIKTRSLTQTDIEMARELNAWQS